MVAVTILVVSIPEGLPLAISLAMSFSISKLRQESLIIRKLDSIENMGRIHHVCVGKGGTLTTGKMEVAKWVFNRTTTEAKNQGFRRFNINEVVKDSLIKQAVILNNTCRIQMTEDDAKYVVEGPSYEKCMLNFLFDNDYDVPHELTEREKNCELLTMIPFNPETKIMIVAYKIDDHDSIESEPTVRIIVKGAPEKVLVLCDMMIDENFNYSQLSDGYSHEA
jgi:magnesium-transporting ATPase (P-type)